LRKSAISLLFMTNRGCIPSAGVVDQIRATPVDCAQPFTAMNPHAAKQTIKMRNMALGLKLLGSA
jgi:hypothetical protein